VSDRPPTSKRLLRDRNRVRRDIAFQIRQRDKSATFDREHRVWEGSVFPEKNHFLSTRISLEEGLVAFLLNDAVNATLALSASSTGHDGGSYCRDRVHDSAHARQR